MEYKWECVGKSIPKLDDPDYINGDTFYCDEEFAILADGVSQSSAADASDLAVTVGAEKLEETLKDANSSNIDSKISDVMHAMNKALYNKRAGKGTRMGLKSTCIMAIKCDNFAYVAWVGDSPGFVMYGGKLKKITEENSRAGQTTESQALKIIHVEKDDFLTDYLGLKQDSFDFNVKKIPLEKIDYIGLFSDAVPKMVLQDDLEKMLNADVPEEAKIENILEAVANPEKVAKIVGKEKKEMKKDDTTIIIIRNYKVN